MTDLTQFIPNVTRVVTPGGIRGTVEQVLPAFTQTGRAPKHPILVRRDDGVVRPYAPAELTVLASEAKAGGPWP